jgi:hypothetical protein
MAERTNIKSQKSQNNKIKGFLVLLVDGFYGMIFWFLGAEGRHKLAFGDKSSESTLEEIHTY